jgi:hypothetical protein
MDSERSWVSKKEDMGDVTGNVELGEIGGRI